MPLLITTYRGRAMSLSRTKKHLLDLLDDSDNKVLALSGKWGTGKSHLWREIKNESADEKVKGALYVSLFGLTSMDQVKMKIVQSWSPVEEAKPSWWKKVAQVWGPGKTIGAAAMKILPSIHGGFSALRDVALLAVPVILKDRVIVLDDIERKNEQLHLDEVLGFIDEFTQQHGTRIVLILNSDQLADITIWETLREKVIDHEVRLQTSPSEAFDVALNMRSTIYPEFIRQALEICSVTNIRIISKVIKTLNLILRGRDNLSLDVLTRIVPSTVLLSVIYFKGLEDGPDLDFVLHIGENDPVTWTKGPEELAEVTERTVKWRSLLQELNIYGCDEYEYIVVQFLHSGMLETADIDKIIQKYATEADLVAAVNQFRAFQEHSLWYHTMTEAELVAEAQTLEPVAHLLDPVAVTWIHDRLSKFAGGPATGDAIVDNWIAAYRAGNSDIGDFDSIFQRPVHPRIRAAIDDFRAKVTENTTIFDACERVAKHRAWGHREETAMKSATVADFEAAIKTLDPPDLRLFLLRFVDLCLNKETYLKHFGSAMEHFTQACRNIVSDPTRPRLAALLRGVFEEANIASELDPSAPETPSLDRSTDDTRDDDNQKSSRI